jgi:hypothetical protein
MTPPPQADAPQTPDEMRLAEQLVDDWYPGMPENREYLVKRVAADVASALSTTAARYREALEPFAKAGQQIAPDYKWSWPFGEGYSIVSITSDDLRRAAAILASGLQTTPPAAPADTDKEE